MQSDQDLLNKIASGDVQAFTVLAEKYVSMMSAYAHKLLRSSDVTQDIVQNVLFRVWDKRATLPQCTSVRSYLLSAVHNAALNYIKSAKSETKWQDQYALEDTLPGLGAGSPEPALETERREMASALYKALDQLPERRREIMLLRLQQLSYSEIAAVMGISTKTVEAQVTQTFALLREALKEWRDSGKMGE